MLDAASGYRRPRLGPVVLLLQLVLVSTGCAGMSTGGGSGSSRGSLDAVMGDELRQSSSNNVYDALRDLRPQWFRPRARASLTFERAQDPVVYISGVREGPLSTLRGIELSDVLRIEFINPLDATTRFGTGHFGRSDLGRPQALLRWRRGAYL